MNEKGVWQLPRTISINTLQHSALPSTGGCLCTVRFASLVLLAEGVAGRSDRHVEKPVSQVFAVDLAKFQ